MQQVILGRRVRCRDMGHRLCVPALLVARAYPGRYGRAGALVGGSPVTSSRLGLAAGSCGVVCELGGTTGDGSSSSSSFAFVV